MHSGMVCKQMLPRDVESNNDPNPTESIMQAGHTMLITNYLGGQLLTMVTMVHGI